jgi:hypothetical protein
MRHILILLLFALDMPMAQEEAPDAAGAPGHCAVLLLKSPHRVMVQVKATDLDFHSRRFSVQWIHLPSQIDSFIIADPDTQDSLLYVTDFQLRRLLDLRTKAERAMATHHLRERILNTAIRYDDLELLAKGEFMCKDSIHGANRILKTAFSSTWYVLRTDTSNTPKTVEMFGLRKMHRTILLQDWSILPRQATLREGDRVWAEFSIQAEPYEKPLNHEFVKPWKPALW